MLHAEPLAGPQSDPYVIMPALVPLRSAVAAGDWAATKAYVEGLADEDDRTYAFNRVTDVEGSEAFLERAAAENPDDPLAGTLLAARRTIVGWNIRTAARATNVSREQFARFHEWLRRSEQSLIRICAEHPAYTLAWSMRLRTARGLELGLSEVRRRYDRLAAHRPHDFDAQRQLVQQLCPKWSGTWEELHAFTRECAAAAPPGSLPAALVAEAHLEHYLDLKGAERADYLRDPAVRDELVAAAATSVLHPDHRPGFSTIGCHSTFAAVLSAGGHHAEAAPHFRVLGDRYTTYAWAYLGDAETEFVNHRTTALQRG